jgi:hypothetical protein
MCRWIGDREREQTNLVDAADHEEGSLVVVIVLAVQNRLEARNSILKTTTTIVTIIIIVVIIIAIKTSNLTVLPFMPVNTSATVNGCERNFWILRARYTISYINNNDNEKNIITMIVVGFT